jgi:hypothetical protein
VEELTALSSSTKKEKKKGEWICNCSARFFGVVPVTPIYSLFCVVFIFKSMHFSVAGLFSVMFGFGMLPFTPVTQNNAHFAP